METQNKHALHALCRENARQVTRRQLFGSLATGVGTAALASLLSDEGAAAEPSAGPDTVRGALPGLPHFPAKARRVIVLWQGGAPSHVDLFDEKHIYYINVQIFVSKT